MAFCPLDYRYGCQEFKEIWSELGRHQRQLEVERALFGLTRDGEGLRGDYAKVAEIAVPSIVTKERVSEIEAETRHDIMALPKQWQKQQVRRLVHTPWCNIQRHCRYCGWITTSRFNYLLESNYAT